MKCLFPKVRTIAPQKLSSKIIAKINAISDNAEIDMKYFQYINGELFIEGVAISK